MTEPTQLIISALETGVDLARGNAEAVHANYKGYYPERHAAADRDVSDMEAALTAARTHLEQPTEDITAGRAALSQPQGEAIATVCKDGGKMQIEFIGDIPEGATVRLYTHPQPTEPAPSTAGDQEDKIVNLPIPASASDLKSDIAELIQSHKYKGLLSIEVLGVFQFLGAEIISGSNS